MVTINDIAKRAGVAKSTVSRYLNGGSVSPKTKRKLDAIVQETGYIPNTFAQSLKARQTNLIGSIIPRLDSYSTNEILSAVDDELRKHHRRQFITNSNQDPEREVENIYALARQKVDGILLFAGEITEEHREAIDQLDIPIVILGQELEGVTCIAHHDEHAGYRIGKYMASLGHEKYLILSVPESDVAIGQKRLRGVVSALEESADLQYAVKHTSFVFEQAYQDCRQLVKELEATAVICLTDTIALAFMKAAHETGLRIPDDISLSGFGGYEAAQIVSPPITTIRYPYKRLGRLAVQTLIQLMEGEEVPDLQMLGNELLIQASTRPYQPK